MQNIPKHDGYLFVKLETSQKVNRLVLNSVTECCFFPFSEILFFQINFILAIVVFCIDNKKMWFQYSHSEKNAFLELLDINKFKLVNKSFYVKIEDCQYIIENTSTMFLKGGYKINDVFKTKKIMKQFQIPKIKLKKFYPKEFNERYNISSGG
jgi:hypothetical protein